MIRVKPCKYKGSQYQGITVQNGFILLVLHIKGILPKGPYLPCISMAGRALLVGYPWHDIHNIIRSCKELWTEAQRDRHIWNQGFQTDLIGNKSIQTDLKMIFIPIYKEKWILINIVLYCEMSCIYATYFYDWAVMKTDLLYSMLSIYHGNFSLKNSQRHPISHLSWWDMGCHCWMQNLI